MRKGAWGEDVGVIAIVDLKGAFTGGGVYAVVVSEGHEGEPFHPVILEMVDKDSEVFFNLLVDSFCLSICLRVIGGRCICLDLEQVIEVFHELGDKHGASVGDDYLWHPMLGVDFIT